MAVALTLAVSTSIASAAPRTKKTDDSIGGTATIEGSYGSGGGGANGCDYVPAASTLAEAPVGEKIEANGAVYRYYSEICHGAFSRAVWIRDYDPADVRARAFAEAERKLPAPTPLMVWPDPDYDWAYAQVPIDFRADPSEWQPFEATATATTPVETVSVTVRADPAELVFTSGDRNGLATDARCSGEGPLAAYDPDVPGECHYTYVNASSTARNGRAFPASLAISWEISYWSTTDPAFSGALPAIMRETVFPVEVAEVKILSVPNYP